MRRSLVPGLCLLVAACGSGGGGGSSSTAAPSGLAYSNPEATYVIQLAIEANVPHVKGKVSTWSVTPALPPGLELDPHTGVISGTPLAEAEIQSYVVTAQGPGGKTQDAIEIGVVHPARFAYAVGGDDAIEIYVVDALTGRLRFQGLHHHDAPDAGAEQVAIDPKGRFVFVPNRGQVQKPSTVSAYQVDPGTGALTLVGHAPTGEGPHRMVVAPSGDFAYVTSFADNTIDTFAIDPVSGALSPLQTIQTNTGPERLTLDPQGRFLYVTHRPSADIAVFQVQPDGTLARSGGGFNYYAFIPSDVAVEQSGTFAYFTFEITNALISYRIDQTNGELIGFQETPTSGTPSAVRTHPTRGYAYVTCADTGTLDVFRLDDFSGDPTLLATYPAGTSPTELAFDPSGRQLYVLDEASHECLAFAVATKKGTLTPLESVRTRVASTGIDVLRGEAPAQPREEFLYVINGQSDDIAGFAVDLDAGALVATGANTLTGKTPQAVAIDPQGRHAWVANRSDLSISSYSIDPATGTLTQLGLPYALPGTPGGLTADRAGDYLYVSIEDQDQVLGLRILTGGTLLQIDSAATGSGPGDVSIDPTGQFLYVSNRGQSPHTISAFSVLEGKFLSGKSDEAAPGHPGKLRFAPDGAFAYVALESSRLVVPYSIDAQTGTLTAEASGSTAISTNPTAVSVTPDGLFAYAAVPGNASESGFISRFAVDPASGDLTGLGETYVGLSPRDLVVGPSGRYLYVANEGGDDLSMFSIDPTSGELSLVDQSPAGLAPEALILATRVE